MENPKIRLFVNPKFGNNAPLMRFLNALPATFPNGGEVLWNKRNQIRRFIVAAGGEVGGKLADGAIKHDDVDESCGDGAQNGGERGKKSVGADAVLTLVVKKFKHPNVFQKIGALFGSSKAEKAFKNGIELLVRGFLTPQPVACIVIKGRVFIKEAYLVTLNTDWPPIADELECSHWNKDLAADFARFAARLHEQGVLHNDLNKTNVLYKKVAGETEAGVRNAECEQRYPYGGSGGHYCFQLIDNNRMHFLPLGQMPSQKECMENLTRFTGDYGLFSFVAEAYARARNLDAEVWLRRALRQKRLHDRCWRRRKAIVHPIRTLKRKRK